MSVFKIKKSYTVFKNKGMSKILTKECANVQFKEYVSKI